jgi:glycosyltransferase involved in cell wall biosynthesis
MKDLRILQVSAYYPPHLGGQEVAVQELATQLAAAGEYVEVVSSDLGGRRGTAAESGVRVTRLKSWELGHSAVMFGLFWWFIKNVKRDTLVHLHFGQFFTSEIVWIASKVIGFNYIIQMHTDPVPSGPLGKLLPVYRRLFFGRELRDASLVIVLNDAHRRVVAERYGRCENVVIMRNGVGPEFFHTARCANGSNAIELVYAGRLGPGKNLDRLIKAVGVADAKVTLHLIGDGEYREALEEAARSEAADSVVFHGRLSRDEIRCFYARCDGFVLPSLYEAQPLSLLEAMACRVPAITTNVVGLGELADCTIVVDTSVEGLASGIDRLARMPASGKADLVERAFQRAQDHGWSRVLDSYIRLYRSVSPSLPPSEHHTLRIRGRRVKRGVRGH